MRNIFNGDEQGFLYLTCVRFTANTFCTAATIKLKFNLLLKTAAHAP